MHVEGPGCFWLGWASQDVLMAWQQSFVTRPAVYGGASGPNCSNQVPSPDLSQAPGPLVRWLQE